MLALFQMKAFMKELVMELDVDSGRVRVGMLTFADQADLAFHLDAFSDRRSILEAIDAIKYTHGKTNTGAAIK